MQESTTFNNEIIAQLNKVLKFVLENPYSDFYRNKYKNLNIKEIRSYEDFQKIPFLTKDEFLSVPIEKRTFVSQDEIKYYSFSSGTTNNKIPTIIPHSSFGHDEIINYYFNEAKLKTMGVNRVMLLTLPLSPIFTKFLTIPRKSIVIVPADAGNLARMAGIAKQLKIEAIMSTSTRLYFFIEHLANSGFDFRQIKWIHMGGEFCSEQRKQYFESKFPNAVFNFGFSTSETSGLRGYKCDLLNDKKPSILHPVHHKLMEVANEEGKILPLGETGELAHTDVATKAFPLIRYKSKDIGSLAEYNCPCGNNFIVTLGGRTSFDVLKFSGVTLYSELIADAVNAGKEHIEPLYQMHVFEEKSEGKLKPKLQLHLLLKKNSKHLKNDMAFIETLRKGISRNLRLSAKSTLEQLADQKIFLPLEIIFLESWPDDLSKSKNIISHLS